MTDFDQRIAALREDHNDPSAWSREALAIIDEQAAEIERLSRDAARWQKIETLWFLGDVTLTTDEDAQFIVHVDPAEHAAQAWTGIDQCTAIDAALAANGENRSRAPCE